MDESVVFELLNPLQFSKLTEGLVQDLLCDAIGKVPHKQHLHLRDGQRYRLEPKMDFKSSKVHKASHL